MRKATVSFVMSVHMKQLGSHWTDFHETWYFSSFRKSVGKIQVSLISVKNNGDLEVCHRRCVCENWKGYVVKHNYVN